MSDLNTRMNVFGSDLLRESYFWDLQWEITAIFNQQPLAQQPQAIVDVSCGDGTLLKQVHQIIHNETVRGQHLETAPITLIGIDENKNALEKTADTLAEIEHLTLLGSIYNPQPINQFLEQKGFTSEQSILYIRCLADHRISIDSKQPVNHALAVLANDQPACYLDQQGPMLDALTVLSGWQQYLQALAQNIVYNSPILLLEAHTLPARLVCRHQDEAENVCFDPLYSLSRQYPIGAESLLILAASVGLFNQNPVKRYPKTSGFCRISLHHLYKRDYIVRHAAETDLDRLYQLEELCWQHTRTPRKQIRARLQKYPQGQFVLEKEGKVLGVIYSQRIAATEALENRTAANVHELHQASGSIIQLLAVNIDPRVQNKGYGDQLLEFMLQRCSLVTDVDQVVGVTLCKNYRADNPLSFAQYIQQQGSDQDSVLAFHHSHGARIVRPIANYRPQDTANQGYGVLVVYNILDRMLPSQPTSNPSETAKQTENKANATGANPTNVSQQQIRQYVRKKVTHLLSIGENEFDPDRPVMEMGLDSADLLKLQRQIEEKYHRKFQSGFFFEYNSINKVIDYLIEQLGAVSEAAPKADSPKQAARGKGVQASEDNKRQAAIHNISSNDIAVIGVSCKLPGGIETPDQLWQVLASGDCVIGSYPESRGNWPAGTDKPGIDRGGFVEHVDGFDAAFFRITPAEVLITDPQQRILLELAWGCLENAAILPEALKGTNTGVFIGASNSDYSRLIQAAGLETPAHYATGSSLAVLANRLSYFFDFSGPSLVIDTACSASLVALHTAVQSLRAGESDAALVGGVNLICYPDLSVAYHKAGMLAPDGRCKVFDAGANGYVRSEGAVMLMLKPLNKAIKERNRIHAVIKGSATNHGGLAGGLTVPNPQKQSELLAAAWKNAGISARDLTYIEAHGTGTPLGDPIEVQGMQKASAQLNPAGQAHTCAIGSVKSNLGHLEAAAGITGLLKVILCMQHRQIPASVNFTRLNPKISLEGTPFYIADKHLAWDAGQRRLAGVSSFGSGGANAHVVVEEWIQVDKTEVREKSCLFVVSAKNKERLYAYAESIISWIGLYSEQVSFVDFIYTFQTGRTAMEERLAIQACDFSDLRVKLTHWLETETSPETETTKAAEKACAAIWQENTKQIFDKLTPLLQGKAGEQIHSSALAERDFEQLALLWTSGFNVDFEALYEEIPHRVSAPTYPFSRQGYWIETPVEEHLNHSLLGNSVSSIHGPAFSKTWSDFPEYFLFTQGGFSCLSLGFILEVFLSAGRKVFPLLEITVIDQFKYYPFHLERGSRITYEIRCFQQNKKLHVELIQTSGEEHILISEAVLTYAEKNNNVFSADIPKMEAQWITSEEQAGGAYSLPIETLKTVFPALLNETSSPVVSISRILFYCSAVSTPSMLVALTSAEISVLTKTRQPVLSIINSSVG